MSDTVIQVDNLSKRYRLGLIGTGMLSHDLNRLWARIRRKPDPYLKIGQNQKAEDTDFMWALRDVSFEVKRGEVLGIIGRNGAGKSTLLKILSRVTAPTSGEVRVRGRIASLLEVGTGFHPELTGRENIFLNGAILGMSKAEIKRKFDEIVAFSEVEKFIDTPVKRYSSGMYVRLAFAVAAHLDPEILIVDEVLAVGDASFQKKCMGRMGDVAGQGRTVLFVSHNMAAIEQLCHNAMLLSNGMIAANGETADTLEHYLQGDGAGSSLSTTLLDGEFCGRSRKEIILRKVQILADGRESTVVRMGGNFEIVTTFQNNLPIPNMRFGIAVEGNTGQRLFSLSPSHQAPSLSRHPLSRGAIRCEVPCVRLLPGSYYLTFIIGSGTADLDRVDRAVMFTVESSDVFKSGFAPGAGHGVYYQEANWALTGS